MTVAVLGAGVVGVATAYYLAKAGEAVTVIDRQPHAAAETSFANAGLIAPGHAYAWASPRAPVILLKSLWRNDTALRYRLRLDPAMWAWSLQVSRELHGGRQPAQHARQARALQIQPRAADRDPRGRGLRLRRGGQGLDLSLSRPASFRDRQADDEAHHRPRLSDGSDRHGSRGRDRAGARPLARPVRRRDLCAEGRERRLPALHRAARRGLRKARASRSATAPPSRASRPAATG